MCTVLFEAVCLTRLCVCRHVEASQEEFARLDEERASAVMKERQSKEEEKWAEMARQKVYILFNHILSLSQAVYLQEITRYNISVIFQYLVRSLLFPQRFEQIAAHADP